MFVFFWQKTAFSLSCFQSDLSQSNWKHPRDSLLELRDVPGDMGMGRQESHVTLKGRWDDLLESSQV